ncbi:MAG: cysteine--tRNA ligase [bacterium]|nr:cysteine--tRNA ligase [bacterium]
MKLYNTLSRSLEEFTPLDPLLVSLYTCGPTVYHFAHIGNLRAFIFYDLLKRTLSVNGYNVKHVMNITDVGHLVSNHDIDDSGEDKMEKGARREGKSVWDVAQHYTDAYHADVSALNIIPPTVEPKATDYIQEQIDLISLLEQKGFTYKTSAGIVYNTAKFPGYAKLSRMKIEELKEGARVEPDPEKQNLTDFYLWKFSIAFEQRQMEWDSPWGKGFPGWHIECSAMAMKLLGETIDIHCGGIDHIPVHHTNEIAQTEGATGKLFSRFWMHNNFLTIVGGAKMAKSGDNFYTLTKVKELGFDPMVFRYFTLTAHYRSELEFSVNTMRAAEETMNGIRRLLYDHPEAQMLQDLSSDFYQRFTVAMNNDLDSPRALSILHEMLSSSLNDTGKRSHLIAFDKILGLGLAELTKTSLFLSESEIDTLHIDGKTVREILFERESARKARDWELSDLIRLTAQSSGYIIEDTQSGQKVKKNR